jgi:FAD dependent oxidoreductase TIGR03364
MKKYDFVIIGGGILGLAHAYLALKAGKSVLLLEKNDRAVGASIRNFGQIVPSGFGREWQHYGKISTKVYQDIQAQYNINIKQEGSVYFASNDEEDTLLQELAVINSASDHTSVLLDKQECHRLYPELRPGYCTSGLFFSDEVKADPATTVRLITSYLVDVLGLVVRFNTFITDVYANDTEAIAFDSFGQKFIGENLLVCTGDDYQTLYPWLYRNETIRLVKLQMMELVPQNVLLKGSILTGLTIRRYESFQECPSYGYIKSLESPEALYNTLGVHILFSQNSDSSIILGDSHEYAPSNALSTLMNHETKNSINDYILQLASEILELDYTVRKSWIGVYSQEETKGIFNQKIDQRIRIITGIGGKGMTASFGWAATHFVEIL